MDLDEMLERASDPTATAEALEAICRQVPFRDRERVLTVVVRNPNLAAQRFRLLVNAHPLEALDNPAFELYALEEPGWFARVSAVAATAMVLAPHGRDRVLDLAALHPHPMPRLYARHLELIDTALLERVMASTPWKHWSTAVARELGELATREPRLRGLAIDLLDARQLVGCAWLPASWTRAALESDGGQQLAAAMTAGGELVLQRQRRLVDSRSRAVRRDLAGNRELAPEIATRLARDEWHAVRLALVGNPATPARVLQQLLADRHEDIVREALTRLRAYAEVADP